MTLAHLVHLAETQYIYGLVALATALGLSPFLRRGSGRLEALIWGLVLLRLILPPNWSSPWSLRSMLDGLLARGGAEGGIAERLPEQMMTTLPFLESQSGMAGGSPWLTLLVVTWLFLSLMATLRLWIAWDRTRKTLAAAKPVTQDSLLSLVRLWRGRLGIRRPVRLVCGASSVSPFTAGALRPVIFLPRTIAETWRPEELESVLAHELVHVRRFDALALLVEAVLKAVFVLHPAAWVAERRRAGLREALCDLRVLEEGLIPPHRYASTLLAILRLRLETASPAPSFADPSTSLKARLETILRTSPGRRSLPGGAFLALAVALLLLPMAGAKSGPEPEGERRADSTLEVSPAKATARITLAHPLGKARVTSPFGDRIDPLSGKKRFHRGLDLSAKSRTPILAPAQGVVLEATTEYSEGSEWGHVVVLDHGSGLRTLYAHVGDILVTAGNSVNAGQAIAEVGSTGQSTGPHLHWEVWQGGEPVDPEEFLP